MGGGITSHIMSFMSGTSLGSRRTSMSITHNTDLIYNGPKPYINQFVTINEDLRAREDDVEKSMDNLLLNKRVSQMTQKSQLPRMNELREKVRRRINTVKAFQSDPKGLDDKQRYTYNIIDRMLLATKSMIDRMMESFETEDLLFTPR